MVAFCKDCRWIYERDYEEMVAEAIETMRLTGVPTAPMWGCGHPQTKPIAAAAGKPFVSCEWMRLNGAPCTPEGLLFEAREDA